jgi:hypothetical protein
MHFWKAASQSDRVAKTLPQSAPAQLQPSGWTQAVPSKKKYGR